MKKEAVFVMIAIVILGMLALYKICFWEDTEWEPYDEGKKLHEMEQESDIAVEMLREGIVGQTMTKEDCIVQISESVENILAHVEMLDERDDSYLNVMYNCNVLRKLAGLMIDKKEYSSEEKKLRTDTLTVFSDKLFSYSLAVFSGTNEIAEYNELCKQAEKIEESREEIVEAYVEKLYTYYDAEK